MFLLSANNSFSLSTFYHLFTVYSVKDQGYAKLSYMYFKAMSIFLTVSFHTLNPHHMVKKQVSVKTVALL